MGGAWKGGVVVGGWSMGREGGSGWVEHERGGGSG